MASKIPVRNDSSKAWLSWTILLRQDILRQPECHGWILGTMGQILGGVSVLKITEATNSRNKLRGSMSVIIERGEEDAAITE